jgi:hypothetical protein
VVAPADAVIGAVTRAEAERDAVPEAVAGAALADTALLPLPLLETLPAAETETDADAEGKRAVGVAAAPLALAPRETLAAPLALVRDEAAADTVPEGLTVRVPATVREGVRVGAAERDALAERVPDGELEGEAALLALTRGEREADGEPEPRGETVGDALARADADGERDASELRLAEVVGVSVPEADAEPHAVPLHEMAGVLEADGDALWVAVCDGDADAVGVRVARAENEGVAEGATDASGLADVSTESVAVCVAVRDTAAE